MEADIYAVDTVAKQIDDIQRGVADVGLGGTAVTGHREQDIDFSVPVLDSGLSILTTADSSRNVGDRIATFFTAIASSDLPWLLGVFALAVLVAAHLIWLLERRHNPDFARAVSQGDLGFLLLVGRHHEHGRLRRQGGPRQSGPRAGAAVDSPWERWCSPASLRPSHRRWP